MRVSVPLAVSEQPCQVYRQADRWPLPRVRPKPTRILLFLFPILQSALSRLGSARTAQGAQTRRNQGAQRRRSRPPCCWLNSVFCICITPVTTPNQDPSSVGLFVCPSRYYIPFHPHSAWTLEPSPTKLAAQAQAQPGRLTASGRPAVRSPGRRRRGTCPGQRPGDRDSGPNPPLPGPGSQGTTCSSWAPVDC